MVQKMRGTTWQDVLPAIVLRHCCVALVNSEEGERTQLDNVLRQGHGIRVSEGLRGPHMNAGWQQDWLAVVKGQTNVALLHYQDGAIAMHQGIVARQRLYSEACDIHTPDVVHPWLREQVAPLTVHEKTNMSCRHKELHMSSVVCHTTKCRHAPARLHALHQVVLLRRVCSQVNPRSKDIFKVLLAKLRREQVVLLQGAVCRCVFHVLHFLRRCGHWPLLCRCYRHFLKKTPLQRKGTQA
mmetsp:Transcript_43591/g.98186  ORF Transcript_43591/g.98186 Transcript_43591/m.98186 type:complete len:240 (+) Transcript_43591:1079-1798(+)